MSMTRLEINFRRLLNQCESLAKDDDTKSSWRLDKVKIFANSSIDYFKFMHNLFAVHFGSGRHALRPGEAPSVSCFQIYHLMVSEFAALICHRIQKNINSIFRKASKEMMADYSKRVEFLKGLRMADQLVRMKSNIFILPRKHQFEFPADCT
jgi:hypothetical protein